MVGHCHNTHSRHRSTVDVQCMQEMVIETQLKLDPQDRDVVMNFAWLDATGHGLGAWG